MRKMLFGMLLFITVAGSAHAILPPDASAREPQIRAYRQRVRDEYEKRTAERKKAAARAYEQTKAEVFTPPWMRKSRQAAAGAGAAVQAAAQSVAADQAVPRLFVSLILLLLIGGLTLGVWFITREKTDS